MKTIYCNGVAVPVSEAVYRAYWQETERACYLDQVAAETCWRESDLAAHGVPPDSWQTGGDSAEVCWLAAVRQEALYAALAELDPEAVEWLWRLVLGETTERALAEAWGISRSAVHKRKQRLLAALRKRLDGADRL